MTGAAKFGGEGDLCHIMRNISAYQKGAIVGGVAPSGAGQARRLWRGLVLAISVTIALPALATERLVIPFDLDKHDRLIADLTLEDGVRAEAVIDTAATMTMVSGHTASALGLAPVEIRPGELKLVTVLGLGGPEDFPLIQLQRLSLGNVHLGAIPAALDRKPEVEGVRNVFPASALDADVLDFDFRRQRLAAYNKHPVGRSRDILGTSPLHDVGGLFFIDVEINGVTGRALVDTGSSITYINSVFADTSLTVTNQEKTKRLLGVTGEEYDLRVARLSALGIGKMQFENLDLIVSDPPLFLHLGIEQQPVMVLGMDFLVNFRVQIDRKRGRFILRRAIPTCAGCVVVDMRPEGF